MAHFSHGQSNAERAQTGKPGALGLVDKESRLSQLPGFCFCA
jgi:hypothetical protein